MAQGEWSQEEKSLHINILELRAVRLALIHLQENFQGHHVLVQTDNTVTKAYINCQGGTRSRHSIRKPTSSSNGRRSIF